jgi:AcrR family transcriptional regulator
MANSRRHPGSVRAAPAELDHAADLGRRRLASAWADSIATRGYRRTTVRHILDSSGVSRRGFYEHFGGKEEAFVAIHAHALDAFASCVNRAFREQPEWPAKVATALATALRCAADRPDEAQLLLGDPFAAGPHLSYCHDLLVARFAPGLLAGRELSRAPAPPGLEAALIGGLVGIISARVRAGAARTLPGLAAPLTEFVLTPYMGPVEARGVARTVGRGEPPSRGPR